MDIACGVSGPVATGLSLAVDRLTRRGGKSDFVVPLGAITMLFTGNQRFIMTIIRCTVLCIPLAPAGCETPSAPGPDSVRSVADFSLTLFVDGQDRSSNPLAQTSRYLVMPDRSLYVALGPVARRRTFPRRYRRLSLAEFDRLIRFVDDHHLLAEPTSPRASSPESEGSPHVRYVVRIALHHRSNEYITTPGESPPTVALLAALAAFRGADLDQVQVPDERGHSIK